MVEKQPRPEVMTNKQAVSKKKRFSRDGGKEHEATLDQNDEVHASVDKILEKAKLVAKAMIDIMSMVQGAPQHMWGDMTFRKMVERVSKLVGDSTSIIPFGDMQLPSIRGDDDEFWGNSDRIAAMEEIENAVAKREEFKKWVDDLPSFNMCLTREVEPSSMSLDILMK